MADQQTRRQIIKQIATGTAAIALTPSVLFAGENYQEDSKLKGNINHSVCSWTYNFLPLDELCKLVKKIGFSAIDLLAPKDWPVLQQHGITCSMCYTNGKISLTDGWNNKSFIPS